MHKDKLASQAKENHQQPAKKEIPLFLSTEISPHNQNADGDGDVSNKKPTEDAATYVARFMR